MKRIQYGFKALPLDKNQVKDRFLISKKLYLDRFFCELYLDRVDITDRNVKKTIINNLSPFVGTYTLHVPLINQEGVFYDPQSIENNYIAHLVEISNALGGAIIILHRCWAFNKEIQWSEAVKRFQEWIWQISKDYQSSLFLIENYGFVFVENGGKLHHYMSPLDHFFPQEIEDFTAWLEKNVITNVHPFLDIAHINLTLNLLRAWELNSYRARDFIHYSLHEKIERKIFYSHNIEDYLLRKIYPYFHISDSFAMPKDASCDVWERYLMSEGLVPGHGDIHWNSFFAKVLNLYDEATFIIETKMLDPRDGVEQRDGLEFIRNTIEGLNKEVNKQQCQ